MFFAKLQNDAEKKKLENKMMKGIDSANINTKKQRNKQKPLAEQGTQPGSQDICITHQNL